MSDEAAEASRRAGWAQYYEVLWDLGGAIDRIYFLDLLLAEAAHHVPSDLAGRIAWERRNIRFKIPLWASNRPNIDDMASVLAPLDPETYKLAWDDQVARDLRRTKDYLT